MQITNIEVDSYKEFKLYIQQNSSTKGIRLFRGQEKNSWDLTSQLYRLADANNKIEQLSNIEKEIFKDFRCKVSKLEPPLLYKSDWDLLSIAQHYKLPTRLIDWTKDSLIALWFAFRNENRKLKFRSVWGLVIPKKSKLDPQKDQLFRGRFIKFFKPEKIDDRIRKQKAWFSIQRFWITKSFSGDGLPHINKYNIINQEEEFDSYLIHIKIPNSLRKSILNELKKVNIDQSSLLLDSKTAQARKLEEISLGLKNKYFH